ncbi:MAG: SMC-Scp complex subunit ScpB [Cyanobacteria bacterium SIG32]|nr:SMC-Scp complex subunit ScpB [Cyanobacteria bacterium SIG32]
MEQLKTRIEAVLFTTAKALTAKEIGEILEVEPDVAEEALLELIMDYSSRDGALEIDDDNGYILQLKEEYMDIVEKLCPVDLKTAVQKTLTIIALKEPLRQTTLIEMRGSTAYEHVQELLEKGFISKTKDKNGRSYNLKTTPKFAEYFKLKGDTRALAKMLDLEKKVSDEKAQ